MKTYIIHATQTVVVSSPQGAWPTETLRSNPTLRIRAKSLDAALKSAERDARKRYAGPYHKVESVTITAALVREVKS